MFGSTEKAELTTVIKDLKTEIEGLRIEREARDKELELSKDVVKLKRDIAGLEAEKSRIKEKHAKEERELRHMIGLEKRRQEFEIEQAKKETTLSVREENLAADKKRFEGQMKFQQERFEKEVGYLKDILGEILERLPTVKVDHSTTAPKAKTRASR